MNSFRKIKPLIVIVGIVLLGLTYTTVLKGNKIIALIGAILLASVVVFYLVEAYNNIKNHQKEKNN